MPKSSNAPSRTNGKATGVRIVALGGGTGLSALLRGLKEHVSRRKSDARPISELTAVVTVTDDEIVAAMRELWENLKVVIEPTCALPWAAVRAGRVDVRGKRAGLVLTGGNVDLDHLPWQKAYF